ncbi:BZ3500_MvSof-1268-A1-R1_Chr5-3g08335 [Microbotryum saponariae]|uniref:BZ3500_MvSof-1268-A1-R1_Chr5-3g08335 protein n=1 Tax=Microbotryum saponariae TaxID=289078 RepID=A0A2X0M8B7_9BASI|nr:BZ3500_MvSof-1268-A1-R1_Chr5-3g08335 [Microbotryum saponariae]SDA08443.1 BZ3501_MvSof-1269-A2-R1_Chr5-3g08063 [Microbotryum saponariae]
MSSLLQPSPTDAVDRAIRSRLARDLRLRPHEHVYPHAVPALSHELDYQALYEHSEPQTALPPGARRPVAALQDVALEKRTYKALFSFLSKHRVAHRVLEQAANLLSRASDPIFCNATPGCSETIHNWRIQVLEPLLGYMWSQCHKRKEGPPVKPDSCKVHFVTPETGRPPGIILVLVVGGVVVSRLPVLFERDMNFLMFGPQPNLFARKDRCKLHLEQDDPIPLDPTLRSHGAQAMLNKLAVLMESGVPECDPLTGTRSGQPRFGLIVGTRMSVLTEAVQNPNNTQEVGYLLSSIQLVRRNFEHTTGDLPFFFENKSMTDLALAVMVDSLTQVPTPSPEMVARLFRPPKIGAQTWRKAFEKEWIQDYDPELDAQIPLTVQVWEGKYFSVRAQLAHTQKPLRFFRRPRGRMWNLLYDGTNVFEAVKFKPVLRSTPPELASRPKYKPSRRFSVLPPELIAYLECGLRNTPMNPTEMTYERLSASDFKDAKRLPVMYYPQLIAYGGACRVFGGVLSKAPSRRSELKKSNPASLRREESDRSMLADGKRRKLGTESNVPTARAEQTEPKVSTHRRTRTKSGVIDYEEPVVLKLYENEDLESCIIESLFYEHVFPLLPSKARALLPPYYGTYRSTDGVAMMLVLGYGGRRIFEPDETEEICDKINAGFELFSRLGIQHGDEDTRNALIRDDGSVCLIDWNRATLDFDPKYLREPIR